MQKEEILKKLDFEVNVFKLLGNIFVDIAERAKTHEGDLAEFFESEKWTTGMRPSEVEIATAVVLNKFLDTLIEATREN